MKKVAFFECFAGASGDMILGALLDLDIDQDWFFKELKKIKEINNQYKIKISNTLKKGIKATDASVELEKHEHHHRGLNCIVNIIDSSEISVGAKNLAKKIFTNLAKAEAHIHQKSLDEIHFHEVGAIDAIVDIVGFSILYTSLSIDKVYISPVNTGSGLVKCAHGTIPVPAPATLYLINQSHWPIDNQGIEKAELLTPTGAAILTTICDEFITYPKLSKINKVAYGAGKKDLENLPNVLRLTIGEAEENTNYQDNILVLETNIDDMQPELYENVLNKLYENNALEAYIIPVIMKKSRPACVLKVICKQKYKNNLENIIFKETTSFGIRSYSIDRSTLDREIVTANIENLGEIRIKIGKNNQGKIITAKPEYEDCLKLAQNKSLKGIYCIINDYIYKNVLK